MREELKQSVIFEQLSVIHNYNISIEGCFRIFGPPKEFSGDVPGNECDIFIYNIPVETEDVLLTILLTFDALYHVKILNRNNKTRCLAFVKFMNTSAAEKSIVRLNTTTIHLHHSIYTKSCALHGKELFIGNINASRYPLHMMEQIILNLVIGMETYTVYISDKYNRYIIKLLFFTVQDLLLSVHDICKYKLFAQSPDIFMDTEPPKRLVESTPICRFTYKSTGENQHWPNEIVICNEKYNQLKMF